MHIKDI